MFLYMYMNVMDSIGVNTAAEIDGFVRFRLKLVGVPSKKISSGGQNLIPLNPIRELRFPTVRPTEHSKMNSLTDSGNFTRRRPKSVGVRLENFFSNDQNLLLSDSCGKLQYQTEKLQYQTDRPTQHPEDSISKPLLNYSEFFKTFKYN